MTKPSPKPTTPLDWMGNPYDPSNGEGYGGKSEHFGAKQRMERARKALAKQPLTEERKASMRERMAHAREVYRMRKMKAKDQAARSTEP